MEGLIEVYGDGKLYCPHCGKFVQYTIDWIERNTVGVTSVSTRKLKLNIVDSSKQSIRGETDES